MPDTALRRKTRRLTVGYLGAGSEHPVPAQSMTTTVTTDIDRTFRQIAEPADAGCENVRTLCPSADHAQALPAIAKKSRIPVSADIDDQPKHVLVATGAGRAGVRVEPGNIHDIGHTIRVSSSAPPVEQVEVGSEMPQSLDLRPGKLEMCAYPSRGRTQVDVSQLADEVVLALRGRLAVAAEQRRAGCDVAYRQSAGSRRTLFAAGSHQHRTAEGGEGGRRRDRSVVVRARRPDRPAGRAPVRVRGCGPDGRDRRTGPRPPGTAGPRTQADPAQQAHRRRADHPGRGVRRRG
ncbi:flavodoxin-dependent (E)-4-hydroxy-3-methylbut-2-enyl-diphosphate synthase [Streptomyces sp. NPDC046870]|uniref:flavodoxin-dependent (E)-4-hydroxy-3-methylbut-2-enyl-diphosphate synthase n=1 Tax=Streptomyces sp. NPDC046870 TaxID=3155135 RepID=UPI003453AE25